MMTETSNPRKGQELKTMGSANAHIFARKIAESDLLDRDDKKVLRDFCWHLCKELEPIVLGDI